MNSIVERADDPPVPIVTHLAELRRRLICSLIILVAGAALVFNWSDAFIHRLARPVGTLVFTMPMEAFDTRLRVCFYGSFLLTLPLLLHQGWLFTAKALDESWRKLILRLLPISYILFLAGALLCFTLVVPAATAFFLSFGSYDVKPLIALKAYLDFVTKITLAFGATFQLPLVMFCLNRMGIVTRSQFAAWRRPFYLLSFILGALMTSPEVLTQIAMAVPMILLFETSLWAMGRETTAPAAAARPPVMVGDGAPGQEAPL